MNDEFLWPPNPPSKTENFMGSGVPVYKSMFGCLNDDEDSYFSRISVANIGFSLDPVKGCPLRCSYCVRLSNETDGLFDKTKPLAGQRVFNIIPKLVAHGDDLIKSLIKHPAFYPNYSVITVSTGSTEAFAPVSEDETESLLEELRIRQKLSNPVWIVTKLGIPLQNIEKWRKLLKRYSKIGKIVLSITSSGLPPQIESHQADRFKFVELLGDCGVYYSHHLRPFIRGVNDSDENIRLQLKRSLPLVKSVCIGGLRMDPGIKIAWQDINNLDPKLLPNTPGKKDMDDNIPDRVRKIMDELGYRSTPLFLHSSQVVAHATGIYDHCLTNFLSRSKSNILIKIPIKEMLKDLDFLSNTLINVLKKLKLHYDLKVKSDHDYVYITSDDQVLHQDYRLNRILIQTIGHMNNINHIFKA